MVNSNMTQNMREQDNSLLSALQKAINGEYSAVACYEHLSNLAPNEKQRNQILEIRNDEIKHFNVFSTIYVQLTQQQPTPQITEQCPNEFLRGLEFALEDEQRTVDFYLDVADSTQNTYIKEQFTRISKDEQNHAVWFLYFYVKDSRF